MADSDYDGSDAGSGDDEPGFDPAQDLDKMSDKERKKWEKNLEKWRIFMDFIFRHISIVTFKYNCFEREELTQFLISLQKGESLRLNTKLKKGEEPEIHSFKTMRECADLLLQHKYINDANRIKRFLDIMGRMKGIGMIAGGFFKALKKGKVKGVDKLKHYLEFWKGFCLRTFNYSELEFQNADSDSFNDLEKRFLVWPTVVRTSINIAQKFLKCTSQSTGMELLSTDPKAMQRHMQAAEFVVAAKLEENLFNRVVHESKGGAGSSKLLMGLGINTDVLSAHKTNSRATSTSWKLPNVSDLDPELLAPITDGGMLLQLPAEPPKEKKKGKKKGKGKKGARGASASSHKGTKKKKKK